ncbi:hypothetical protein AT15_06465 [Kosmotoga arenicorallina S304]|uniref:Polysaccharide pyruvyl transferase domain-containing protein n=1 Tax=Kosmotoga arenicorallina S304 TaxID=1453497 RepID=A0A176JTK2_9BACT|nr:polysaccharide pyruvyl transferase family protein [Kosmotoga arenicorallina]OAA26596.1 hypothetical protein AT15_06465 [Kosmotoga arenicorallina S304]
MLNFSKSLIRKLLEYKTKIAYRNRTKLLFKNKKERSLILIFTPEHSNLGDHAIALAERRFLKAYFPTFNIIEISGRHYKFDWKHIKRYISKNDLILIHGGGFLGTLWIHNEKVFRNILSTFPDNEIIVFPQSIYFSKDEFGRRQMEISKKYYEGHSKLTLCVRDLSSLEFIKNYFSGVKNVLFLPDMVTYLNLSKPKRNRDGVILCFREDREKVFSKEQVKMIEDELNCKGVKFRYTCTISKYPVDINMRKLELEKKFEEFKTSKLVLTDRLHGMLFSAITGTPCIALNNISGKVKGGYEWIKYLRYVRFADNFEDIKKYINEFFQDENAYIYENTYLKKYFDILALKISSKLKGI